MGLTDLGNIAIAGPVLAVAVAWLWRHRLHAVALSLAINAALAIVADFMLKLVSRHIGGAFLDRPWHLTTGAPSGHATVSTVIYGGIGMLFLLRGRGATRLLGAALAVALIACVGVTRVTLGYHSIADVLTGITLGAIFVGLVTASGHASPGQWPPLRLLLLAMIVVAAAIHLSGLRVDSAYVL